MTEIITLRSPFFALDSAAIPELMGRVCRAPIPHNANPANAVGIIPIVGLLGDSPWADTTYRSIQRGIDAALDSPSVREIILYVKSPGGEVCGLPECGEVIYEASRRKPVHAMIDGLGASAGYWLAGEANTISITSSGQVGSVGCVDLHVDLSEALKQAGVQITTIANPPDKVARYPYAPLGDEARADMEAGVRYWHGEFLRHIKRGRGARLQDPLAGNGRLLRADEAKRLGLVDFVNGGAL